MEITISYKFLHHSNLFLSPQSSSQFNFKSNSPKNLSFLQKKSKKSILCSFSVSCSALLNSTNYGGWEDLKLIEDSNYNQCSSKFDQFRNFLVSLGIDDRKHVFMFILGFVSALAISRVRVSSILVFPATVLVFALGFSLGFVRRGNDVGFSMKKVVKDEKLRNLVELFSELSVKMSTLENEMKGDLELDNVEIGGFDNYQNAIKLLSLDIMRGKSIVKTYVNDMGSFSNVNEFKRVSLDDIQTEKNLNQKSSKKKRESFASYFDAFQFIGGLFQEKASVVKPNKVKETAKDDSIEPLRSKVKNDQNHVSVSVKGMEDMKAESDRKIGSTLKDSSQLDSLRNQGLSQHVAEFSVDKARKEDVIPEMMNGNSTKKANDIQTLSNNKEFSSQNYSMPFMNNQEKSVDIGHPNGTEMFIPHDNLYDPLDLGINTRSSEIDMRSFTMNSKASFHQEEILKALNGYHVPSYRRGKPENVSYDFELMGNGEISVDPTDLDNKQAAYDSEEDSELPSSSVVSEDLVFSKHLTEATNLLREARECLKGKADEDRAEVKLYKSAKLLSRATAMKPMSLLAVGQLGNTFLLHGKLKLRISRELRRHLSKRDSSFSRVNSSVPLKELDVKGMSRDRIASTLIDVCEECEGLLVEAGRQYRMALSIDGSDVRALYNWGIALSYRAQLIADVGPEAASDADKVYLAAIDKFDAMMSRNKAYAPDGKIPHSL
ncbi:hypothetical protein AQUCO_02300213v1 [Aquilegia coerulea]|uniref:Uncharacterized protein n=1 Tax=Aquilegia coerulea TaxID=218851 RepID=A0A2G5DCN0_AQUCA|nr:hypothetical protein AQUCO_02300213v1 [Aquilegia coerulea]